MSARDTSFSLQPRDMEILRGLFESRAMTINQAAALYFDGSREAAKKRLQKLKAAKFISERARGVTEPAVLHLSKSGLALLKERNILSEYPALPLPTLEKRARVSDATIQHELEVMDIRAAFHQAIELQPAHTMAEFSTWPRLHEFESFSADGEALLVRPDGFIRIHEREADGSLSEHCFFLEVDRSTESLDTLVQKAAAYLNLYRSGGFAERHGGTRAEYQKFPFRLLFVLKTAERRNNLAERLLINDPPILGMAYLTTTSAACECPLQPVWICPADYRDAVNDSPFDVSGYKRPFIYQRKVAREELVEQTISKRALLA